jgi:nuclear transport factor 2 (NTF2) superfamily protein
MRTHGNEHWEFDDNGLMRIRDMSANDYPIKESDRRYKKSHMFEDKTVYQPATIKQQIYI